MRILLGGIVGGILLFLWGYVDHALLPFGRMGFSEVPNEARFRETLKTAFDHPGLYFFPWVSENATDEQQKAWQEQWAAGPSGLLVLQPTGKPAMDTKTLAVELGSDIVVALLASWVLTVVGAGYGSRVAVVTMFGLVGWLAIDISYWNWYSFPTDFILAQLADQGLGSLLMGLVLAAIIRPPSFPGEADMI